MGKSDSKQSRRRRRDALSGPGAYVQVLEPSRRSGEPDADGTFAGETAEDSADAAEPRPSSEREGASGEASPLPGGPSEPDETALAKAELARGNGNEQAEPAWEESQDPPASPSMRPSVSGTTVLDAQPSFGPPSSQPPEGLASWVTALGVAALSSIILAAGVVALRENFSDRSGQVLPVRAVDDDRSLTKSIPPPALGPEQQDESDVLVPPALDGAALPGATPEAPAGPAEASEQSTEVALKKSASSTAKPRRDTRHRHHDAVKVAAETGSVGAADKLAPQGPGDSANGHALRPAAETEPAADTQGSTTLEEATPTAPQSEQLEEPLSTTEVPPAPAPPAVPANPYDD